MRKLAISEARYRNVVEAQSDFILRVDPAGKISFVNEAYCRRIGRQRRDLLGMRLTDFIVLSPEDRKAYEALLVDLTPDNPISQTEIRSTTPDGRVLHTHWTDSGIFDEGGNLVELQSVGRDITEQKRIAEALAESEERYRNVVEAQTEYVVRFDARGRMSFANDAYCRLVGKTKEELLSPGWHYMDSYDPDHGAGFEEIIGRLSPANPVRHTDAWGRLRDGRIVHIGWTDRGMFDADGRLLEIQAVGRDVTEQKRALEALEASEERYRSVVETQTELVVRQRPDGSLTFVNEAYCRSSGMTREELLDPDWCDFDRLPDDERERLEAYLARLTPDNPTGTIELRNVGSDGEVKWESWTDRGFFDESGRLIETQAVGRDITEQKQALEALEASEERYRSVVEAQTEFVLRMTPDGYLTFVNEAYCRYCNMTREQMLDPGYCDLDQLPQGERQRFGAHIARLTPENPVASIELKNHQIMRGTSWSAWTDRGIFDESGKLVEVQSVGRDVTERVKAEQAREEAEAEISRQRENLHQSEKLSALGSLLAGVAHELNNPLSVVIGYSSMLKEFATDPAVSLRADKIHDAAERCSRIVRTFLAMARKKPPSRGPIDIGEVIMASLELTAYGLRSAGVEVVTRIPGDLPPVYGDTDQLPQVFTNLLVNAQQALLSVPAPRRLTIVAHPEPGGVEIVVADNGPGMKAEVSKRIFEPFFTTKPAGVGTGVGLSVCQAIVTAHEGRISVESSEGKGARFTIFLPCVAAAVEVSAVAAEARPEPSRHARVLVVDDEPDIAAMIAEMLRHDGHEAEVADSAEAALAAVRAGGVDLVVSDIRMPGLDGPGFYRALEGVAENLAGRVLFVTGDTLAPEIDRFISDTGAPVIEKPIDPTLFRKAIAERLAEVTRTPS